MRKQNKNIYPRTSGDIEAEHKSNSAADKGAWGEIAPDMHVVDGLGIIMSALDNTGIRSTENAPLYQEPNWAESTADEATPPHAEVNTAKLPDDESELLTNPGKLGTKSLERARDEAA